MIGEIDVSWEFIRIHSPVRQLPWKNHTTVSRTSRCLAHCQVINCIKRIALAAVAAKQSELISRPSKQNSIQSRTRQSLSKITVRSLLRINTTEIHEKYSTFVFNYLHRLPRNK